ncbi:hypothetical protein QBC34DRAFT_441820 [Podospora aff. communis PSN243]|uniref:Uncharacterized protein n=1 Tax=Podospora aff. communis PSN243 TaxID=3040156 RepID=A0AAV9GBI4_9PEZI|nr:hypothetical protein QBC34DRAFT_441820 [Podospora aff. communis PSN243]
MDNLLSTCAVTGNEDMYGLGVRLGFYLQWLAAILANALRVKDELQSLRFANLTYSMAVLIALTIEKARGNASPLDQYVILCLCFGAYYSHVVTFIWRLATGFNENWDPSRWTAVAPKPHIRIYAQLLMVATMVLQFIFWARLPSEPPPEWEEEGCERFGFLIVPVSLYGFPLKVVSLVLSSVVTGFCLLGFVAWFLPSPSPARKSGGKDEESGLDSEDEKGMGQFLEPKTVVFDKRAKILFYSGSLVNLLIAVFVITATELTLRWNNVVGVYGLVGIGQVMTVILGLVAFFHVPWAAYQEYKDRWFYDSSSSDSSSSDEDERHDREAGEKRRQALRSAQCDEAHRQMSALLAEDQERRERGDAMSSEEHRRRLEEIERSSAQFAERYVESGGGEGGNRRPQPSKPEEVDVQHKWALRVCDTRPKPRREEVDVQHQVSIMSVGSSRPNRRREVVDVGHDLSFEWVASTRRDSSETGSKRTTLWNRTMSLMARTAGT